MHCVFSAYDDDDNVTPSDFFEADEASDELSSSLSLSPAWSAWRIRRCLPDRGPVSSSDDINNLQKVLQKN